MKKLIIIGILLLMIVTVFGQRAIRVSGGREIELQENAGWVEWRYVGAVTWEQLYEIPEGGTGTDEKVKYDIADPIAGYLFDKIIAGNGITLTEGAGLDENKLVITATGGSGDSISIISGLGMNFNNDTVHLGLPSTITSDTENALTDTSHTHELGNVILDNIVSGSPVQYGPLYNWYAATDTRKISSSDTWRVPLSTDVDNLFIYCGNAFGQFAGKLKSTSAAFWQSPNTGAENFGNFNAVGGGNRNSTTNFTQLNQRGFYWIANKVGSNYAVLTFYYLSGDGSVGYGATTAYIGHSIKLMRDATSEEQLLDDGTFVEPYTGNNSIRYKAIKLGTQIWMYSNLNETKYRNGDWITGFDDGVYTPIANASWNTLTTEAMCYYSDNEDYGGGETPLATLLHPPVTINPASAAYASIDSNQVLTIEEQIGISGGDVWQAGTQTNNQVAVWTNDSTIAGTDSLLFDGTNLTVAGTTTGTNFILSSDRRLKTEINLIGSTAWIDEIPFVSFYMKTDSSKSKLRYGVIAQDVEKVNPYLINKDAQGMLSVSYIDLLIAKVARQDEIIRGLIDRIEKLEK